MAGGLKIIRAVPSPTHLVPILRDFCRGEGTVTAFSDTLLYSLRRHVDDDWPVSVEPFGKIVREYLALCGESARLIAPTGAKRAAIGLAAADAPEDSPFSRSAKFTGTHTAIARTLDELSDCGIDAASMESMASQATLQVRAKLESLAAISRSAGQLMEAIGRQSSSEQIRACLDSVPERDGTHERLLIFGGSDVPQLKLQWIAWAVSQGTQVTLVLDRHATGASLFMGADAASSALGVPGASLGEGNRLLNNLFSEEEEVDGAPIRVEIRSAADPFAEAEWAVRGCLEAPRPAIYARNLQRYAPLLESAARRLGLPVRVFRRAPLLTNSFARLTLCVLEFCAGNDVRKLEPVLRSTYVRLAPEVQARTLEALRDARRSRTGQWSALEGFAATHADEVPWIGVVLEWRRRALQASLTARDWLPMLAELLRAPEAIPWSTAGTSGSPAMRERDIRARNRMEQIVADTLSVRAASRNGTMSLQEIASVCREQWQDADVSIPPEESGVPIVDDVRFLGGVDTLFVLGMLEGVFPRRRSEDPILTDAERAEIGNLAGTPLPTSHDHAREERDEFYRVCAAAGNRLVFSYPTADDEKDNIPAFYLTEVARAAGSEAVFTRNFPRPHIAPAPGDCSSPADLVLRQALDAPREDPSPNELVTDTAKHSVLPGADTAFTPGEMRDSFLCPFLSTFRHRLGVEPRRRLTRWNSLRRLPTASDLSVQPSAEAATIALNAALEAELDSVSADTPDWEVQLMRAGGQRLIRSWVERELKAREKWAKTPGSMERHARFGDQLNGHTPGGGKLRGSVPAVSRLGSYRVAHLVASSVPEKPELTDPDHLYYGLHLLGLHGDGADLALEVESMGDKRVLMLLGRSPGTNLGVATENLKVLDLSIDASHSRAQKQFFDRLKKLVAVALSSIREGSIEPQPGEHCAICDFGELCRRSSVFGEEESWFGPDSEGDHV